MESSFEISPFFSTVRIDQIFKFVAINIIKVVFLFMPKLARKWINAVGPISSFHEFRSLFPQFTGVLTLAFFIHNCVITLLKNNKNPENNVRDLSVAYLLVGLTYLYVGILIFAVFPSPPLSKDCIEPNFLDNFPSSDILVFIARACLLFQMSTVYPLLGYLVRVQRVFHVMTLNLIIVGAGVLMARFYPNIGSIIRYSGATCGLAYVFVFPSVIHMISLHRSGQLRWPSAVFHSFLIVLGIANLIGQFLM
ncbi:UNVERIFIED_CONTAM: hypothetical protein FKN15_059868 [Acipenser sinensis]